MVHLFYNIAVHGKPVCVVAYLRRLREEHVKLGALLVEGELESLEEQWGP